MDSEIFKAGVIARAAGRDVLDNPYYRSPNTPEQTGETPEAWEQKALAWDAGWRIEDLMRSGE